ncbi:MAG: hypothetical protein ACKPHU_20510, partial [Planctomycetaceae bacterium]
MVSRRQFLIQSGLFAGLARPRSAFGQHQFGAAGDDDELLRSGPAQGPWRRLFLDAAAVEEQQGLQRVFHSATPFEGNPVLPAD